MSEIVLPQSEADRLIRLEKHRVDSTQWNYPTLAQAISIPLISADRKENFIVDISRGRIDLLKGTIQNRARQIVILVRLDFGGAPHRNPDGAEVSSPHLHLYREGYGDKWAIPIPSDSFSNLSDRQIVMDDFLRYINTTLPPDIQMELFV